jgi:hypothetical protein
MNAILRLRRIANGRMCVFAARAIPLGMLNEGEDEMKTIDYMTVDFSYPTSTNAKRFGFQESGCWTVNLCYRTQDYLGRECLTTKAHSGHETKEQAEDMAKKSFPRLRWLRVPARFEAAIKQEVHA